LVATTLVVVESASTILGRDDEAGVPPGVLFEASIEHFAQTPTICRESEPTSSGDHA